MNLKTTLILLAAIASEVLATSSLKLTAGFTRQIWLIPVVVGYVLAFYLLSLTLQQVPVGIAYAIWSGVGTIGITVVGWYFFRQQLSTATIVGMALVLAGVLLMNLSGDAIADSK
jgi:small multidrug resistance pump